LEWDRDTSRVVNWLRWIIVAIKPSHMLFFFTNKGRIYLLRNVHKRRRETHLSLGRITSVTWGRIVLLISLMWITRFPLRRVTRCKDLAFGEEKMIDLEDPKWDLGLLGKVVQNLV
jgi:hypothetical protein